MDVQQDRRFHGTDHDLLVRIDERLLGIMGDVNTQTAEIATMRGRLEAVERRQAEQTGEDRMSAKTMVVLMWAGGILMSLATAIIVRVVDRLL